MPPDGGNGHICPQWCHVCPDLSGDIMPWCTGGAVYNDLGRCTCDANNPRNSASLEARVKSLEKEVAWLKKLVELDPQLPSRKTPSEKI